MLAPGCRKVDSLREGTGDEVEMLGDGTVLNEWEYLGSLNPFLSVSTAPGFTKSSLNSIFPFATLRHELKLSMMERTVSSGSGSRIEVMPTEFVRNKTNGFSPFRSPVKVTCFSGDNWKINQPPAFGPPLRGLKWNMMYLEGFRISHIEHNINDKARLDHLSLTVRWY